MQHQYVRTAPLPELAGETGEARHPIIRHQDRALYFRQHGECYGIGSSDHVPLPVDPDDILDHDAAAEMPASFPFTTSHFEKAHASAVEFIPCLRGAKLAYKINGMFSFTPDAMPILGESPEVGGFWAADAVWITHAGGVGKAIAEWIVDGSPGIDLRECDITRFHHQATARSYIIARSSEQYREGPVIHHPLYQMESARDLRLTPFHRRHEELRAVFSEGAGWEMPRWYAANERLLADDAPDWPERAGWEALHWSPIVGAEHRATRNNVAMFDVSPITKLEISGPGALRFLQYLTTNQMDQPPGRVTYTSMLNSNGGIMCDLTVTRLEAHRFIVMTSVAFGIHDLTWVRRHVPDDGSVTITDITASLCNLCVGGLAPGS